MCEFCTKHGEGKKWYLNIKNYSGDLLSDLRRRKLVKEHYFWTDKTYNRYIKRMPTNIPILRNVLKPIIKMVFAYKHWSQIIPIEDAEKILRFTNSIVRTPCICRKISSGKECRLCLLVSIDPANIGIPGIIDSTYFGPPDVAKFESVEKDWAINFIKENQAKGMVNTIWAINAPFAGILCSCDLSSGCLAMKVIKDGIPFSFRAEYVAEVDCTKCKGCKECIKICQFNAVIPDRHSKVRINAKKCYGCGICRSTCKFNAIKLVDRYLVKEAVNLW